jgi:hypothetical protein
LPRLKRWARWTPVQTPDWSGGRTRGLRSAFPTSGKI